MLETVYFKILFLYKGRCLGDFNFFKILIPIPHFLSHIVSTGMLETYCKRNIWILRTSPEIERQTHQYYPKRLHFQNGNRRYKYLVLGHEETYFVSLNIFYFISAEKGLGISYYNIIYALSLQFTDELYKRHRWQ